jgi:hypothetical protein
LTREQKITLGEMRASGVRGLLIYCSDFRCSLSTEITGDSRLSGRSLSLSPTTFARIGVMRALNRHVGVFNPTRKEPHWGRRKPARDR